VKHPLLVLVAIVVIGLGGVMTVRTVRVPAAPPPAATGAAIPIDEAGAPDRLAGAIRFPTVSYATGAPIDTAAFLGLHDYLAASFPMVDSALTREVVGGLSLIYRWPGADTSLAPVVLMGHMDVVPVPAPTLDQWSHAPFAGDVADGYVWGRGTMDDKTTVVSILEAVETLLRQGFRPPRTVYLTFGHDEEVGGRFGARVIVDTLAARGVTPALVLDEGGFLASNLIPGLAGRTAIIGIAEKGYLTLRLTAHAPGGHSSMPAGRTAVGALSRAITALEASPFPYRLEGATRTMLERSAPYASFGQRMLLANLWLTGPIVRTRMREDPLGSALLHTTTSPTILSAGVKDNVLPPEAVASVNFRILPGETTASVIERVKQVIADTLITVAPADSAFADPSAVSDVEGPAYRAVVETVREMAPGEELPVVPYLVMGGTDAKYWGARSDRVYRFLAVALGEGDRERVHGLDERVATETYLESVRFFGRLLQRLDGLER